jgi:hypothetical protein
MTRKLRNLMLLVGALLALGGLMASAAGAHVPARFTSEQNVTTLRGVHDAGTSNTTFTVTGTNVTCEIEEFHGLIEPSTTEKDDNVIDTSRTSVTITPTYTECEPSSNSKVTGFGHYPASEGAGPYCDYELKANGGAGLVCPAGKDVTYDIFGSICVIHVPAQNIAGTIEFTTGLRSGKHDLTLDINLSGITTNHTDGFGCPLSSGGESSGATLVGEATAWGQDPTTGAAVGITWDATTA